MDSMLCVCASLGMDLNLADVNTEYLSPTSYEDVVELLVPELQKRGVYWNDYAVPGGTLRENMFSEKGASSVDAAHPAYKFKWNVRETNGVSAWNSRVNAWEEEQKLAELAAKNLEVK